MIPKNEINLKGFILVAPHTHTHWNIRLKNYSHPPFYEWRIYNRENEKKIEKKVCDDIYSPNFSPKIPNCPHSCRPSTPPTVHYVGHRCRTAPIQSPHNTKSCYSTGSLWGWWSNGRPFVFGHNTVTSDTGADQTRTLSAERPVWTRKFPDSGRTKKDKTVFFNSKTQSQDSGRKSNKKIDNFYYYLQVHFIFRSKCIVGSVKCDIVVRKGVQ